MVWFAEEKVPPAILDFISEHHGNQTIGFFYRKAQRIDGGR